MTQSGRQSRWETRPSASTSRFRSCSRTTSSAPSRRSASRMLFQDDRLPYLAHHHGHHVRVDLGGIVALKPIECSENLGITLPLLPHLLDQKAEHFNRRGGGVLDLAVELLLRHRTRTS